MKVMSSLTCEIKRKNYKKSYVLLDPTEITHYVCVCVCVLLIHAVMFWF